MNGPAGRHYRAPAGPPFRAPGPTDMSGLSSDFTDDYLAPILSLGAIKDAARRRWRLLATAALLGMVFGASFHFVLPKKYAAVTDLYLVQPANVNPDTGMANDASLLQTSAVAGRAVSSLHLNESAATFLSSYTGKALSDVVLQIKFNAPTVVAAVSYDNAVANAFLAVRNAQFSSETNLVVSSLEGQVNNLTTEINHLTAEIDALSGPNTGRQEASQIAALVASRGSAYNEETQLQAQEQQSLLAAKLGHSGEPCARPARGSPERVGQESGRYRRALRPHRGSGGWPGRRRSGGGHHRSSAPMCRCGLRSGRPGRTQSGALPSEHLDAKAAFEKATARVTDDPAAAPRSSC